VGDLFTPRGGWARTGDRPVNWKKLSSRREGQTVKRCFGTKISLLSLCLRRQRWRQRAPKVCGLPLLSQISKGGTLMSHRVFLTGAAGFIGFHLARHLVKRGDGVLGYDNFNDYYSPELKRARAAELKKVGVEIIEGDLCDQERLNTLLAAYKPTH